MHEDDRAFAEDMRRGVCVQFESRDEALGGVLEEIRQFLIKISFVCAMRGRRSGGGKRNCTVARKQHEPCRTSKDERYEPIDANDTITARTR